MLGLHAVARSEAAHPPAARPKRRQVQASNRQAWQDARRGQGTQGLLRPVQIVRLLPGPEGLWHRRVKRSVNEFPTPAAWVASLAGAALLEMTTASPAGRRLIDLPHRNEAVPFKGSPRSGPTRCRPADDHPQAASTLAVHERYPHRSPGGELGLGSGPIVPNLTGIRLSGVPRCRAAAIAYADPRTETDQRRPPRHWASSDRLVER